MSSKDILKVGGKNASLGELWRHFSGKKILVPDGFAINVLAFQDFIDFNGLGEPISELIHSIDIHKSSHLQLISVKLKKMILGGQLPLELIGEIESYVNRIKKEVGATCTFAIRSSATCEDSPLTSFAGLHDSFLNIQLIEDIQHCILQCYASLYNHRALNYRLQMGIPDEHVFMSVGIQQMVRSDLPTGSSGVCFTIDPDTGFKDLIVIQSSWGLGENIVQGKINPDEFIVFKPFLYSAAQPVISTKLGGKEKRMVFNKKGSGTMNKNSTQQERRKFSLSHNEVCLLSDWAEQIENHYKQPMDIEWARDGRNGNLYIVQARPETIHRNQKSVAFESYHIWKKGSLLTKGTAVGYGIVSGKAKHLPSVKYASHLEKGEILIAKNTTPDWDPILKKAAAIITERGGRTSHAAIVAREMGALAIVGANDVFRKIKNGEVITVDDTSPEGKVYRGKARWTQESLSMEQIPETRVKPMLILADPEKAFYYASMPSKGVGLLRMEFIITNSIGIHPMALIHLRGLKSYALKQKIHRKINPFKDGRSYYISRLSQGIAKIAAAFYPRPVTVRLSDFKSDEYAGLLGGELFEVREENPMIGLRGASRYYNSYFKEAFELEIQALKMVREEMGFLNIQLMIPFCRTPHEADTILELLEYQGMKRGERDLKIWMMCEIPSNVILAEAFLQRFDGMSIGSNDLTQLVLGVDRGNPMLDKLFDENDPAVRSAIRQVIMQARKMNLDIGLCGQKPSDDPAFAEFLVQEGITSISFNPDALLKGIQNINYAETNGN